MDPLLMIKIAVASIEGLVKVFGQLKTGEPVVHPDGSVDIPLTISVGKNQLAKFLAQQQSDSEKNRAEIERRKSQPS